MLDEEDEIKGDAEVAETEFDRIPGNAGPVPLQAGVEHELGDGEDAAGEIQHDLFDAPTHGGFTLVVDQDLRNVFDDGDDELDVTDRVDEIDPRPTEGILSTTVPGIARGDDVRHHHQTEDTSRDDPGDGFA